MHLNQITSPQPQQQRLEFRLNCDRQSDDCEAVYLRPKITAFSAENGQKNENDKYIFGRKRKWPKPSKIVIFGAENENEFRSVSSPVSEHFLFRSRTKQSIFARHLARNIVILLLSQSINVVLLCKVYKHFNNFRLT